jgi:hypothetical protein
MSNFMDAYLRQYVHYAYSIMNILHMFFCDGPEKVYISYHE